MTWYDLMPHVAPLPHSLSLTCILCENLAVGEVLAMVMADYHGQGAARDVT